MCLSAYTMVSVHSALTAQASSTLAVLKVSGMFGDLFLEYFLLVDCANVESVDVKGFCEQDQTRKC